MPPYSEKSPPGTRIRVANREHLERFRRDWRLHNPLKSDQLTHAGAAATVREVGFYHGGDVLYSLNEIDGIWHEACLVIDMSLDLDSVVDFLCRFHQRATYGAVGGVVDRPPAFLMGGFPRNHRYSWVVNAKTSLPTGYTDQEMHSSLRERDHIIASAAELEEWLRKPS